MAYCKNLENQNNTITNFLNNQELIINYILQENNLNIFNIKNLPINFFNSLIPNGNLIFKSTKTIFVENSISNLNENNNLTSSSSKFNNVEKKIIFEETS